MGNNSEQPQLEVESVSGPSGILLGHRISIGEHVLLVYANQELMPGFRDGAAFIDPIGESLSYTRLTLDNPA